MNLELTTATGYLTSYYAMLLFSPVYGFSESIGIYCAQAWGSEDKNDRKKMYLMFKQACFLMAVYFLCVTTPLAFFFEDFLVNWIGATPEVAAYA
jgi:Na+-driven multidrug efflux pump